jgi:hypothetical protein
LSGIEGFPEVKHPINTTGDSVYLGGSEARQLYRCGWCGEYWLKTTITGVTLDRVLSESVKPVGRNPDGIK